jgi:hypothetical protein
LSNEVDGRHWLHDGGQSFGCSGIFEFSKRSYLQQELDAARIFRQQKKDGISFTGPEGPIKDRFVVMERVDVGNKIQREKVVVDQ